MIPTLQNAARLIRSSSPIDPADALPLYRPQAARRAKPKAYLQAMRAGSGLRTPERFLVANTATAFGFRHIGYTSGGSPDYQLATGTILSSNATKIFRGDPVIYNTATGNIEQGSSNTVIIAGVFDGCMYTPVGGTPQWSPFWPGAAGSNATAYIINAPNALFMAAALNTSLVTANIGETVGFAIGVGNLINGFSGATVDQSTLATLNNTTGPFKVVAPVTNSGNFGQIGNGNDPTTPFGWAVVTFNNEIFKTTLGA